MLDKMQLAAQLTGTHKSLERARNRLEDLTKLLAQVPDLEARTGRIDQLRQASVQLAGIARLIHSIANEV